MIETLLPILGVVIGVIVGYLVFVQMRNLILSALKRRSGKN